MQNFYVVSALLIWAAGCLAAGKPQSASWSFATGTTQVILLLSTIAALGAHAVMAAPATARFHHNEHAPLERAVTIAALTLVTGSIWFAGTCVIFGLWKPIMADGAAFALLWLVSTPCMSSSPSFGSMRNAVGRVISPGS